MAVEFEEDSVYGGRRTVQKKFLSPTTPPAKKYSLIGIIVVLVAASIYFVIRSEQHSFPSAAEHEKLDALELKK